MAEWGKGLLKEPDCKTDYSLKLQFAQLTAVVSCLSSGFSALGFEMFLFLLLFRRYVDFKK